jgi:hypothetical protein
MYSSVKWIACLHLSISNGTLQNCYLTAAHSDGPRHGTGWDGVACEGGGRRRRPRHGTGWDGWLVKEAADGLGSSALAMTHASSTSSFTIVTTFSARSSLSLPTSARSPSSARSGDLTPRPRRAPPPPPPPCRASTIATA